MSKVIRNYNELLEQLHMLSSGSVVGLEGFSSAGKTELANRLSKELNWSSYSLDLFANQNKLIGSYIERIDSERLRHSLRQRDASGIVLIEGICLRDILDLVDQKVNLYIYIKRLSANGIWHDGLCHEDFIVNSPIYPEPHNSDHKYHARIYPQDCAGIVYEWEEVDRMFSI